MNNTLKNQREYGPKNAKMCSTNIQNEIIACIAKFIRMNIKDIVEKTKYF